MIYNKFIFILQSKIRISVEGFEGNFNKLTKALQQWQMIFSLGVVIKV